MPQREAKEVGSGRLGLRGLRNMQVELPTR